MAKLTKHVSKVLLLAFVLLLLNGFAPIAHAAASDSVQQVYSNELIEFDFADETQHLKLVKGKQYLISCPVMGEGWQISEVYFALQDGTWLRFEEDVENEYIFIQKWEENEPGKVQILIKCKQTNLIGLRLSLENEVTGEKKDYALALTVSIPQPESDSHFVVWQPLPPDEGNDEPTPSSPIIIDTTGWSFNSITAVYDGTEYIVEVTGLPDYVTPVYTNNTRTNAGISTAHVSFLVPEGYVTPEDMETTITIEKAPLCVINKENLVETADGKLKFFIPDSALPDGVSYTYTVNDAVVDNSYTINHTGMYIVNTQFDFSEDFTEEMKQNYITDNSVIYNVLEHEDITPSEYGLNFVLKLEQAESQSSNEVRVTVSIEFDSSTGRNSVLTYVPVYDPSILNYVGSELPDGMGGGKISSSGIVPAYSYSGGLLNDGPLTTFIFTANEGTDISNLPFTITEISGAWISPDFSQDYSTSYSVSIVLNPSVDTEQYTVMLPRPATLHSTSQNSMNTPFLDEASTVPPAEEQTIDVEISNEPSITEAPDGDEASTVSPTEEHTFDVETSNEPSITEEPDGDETSTVPPVEE